MKRFIIFGVILTLLSISLLFFHFVRTEDALMIALKASPTWSDTFIDVRGWGFRDFEGKETLSDLRTGRAKPLYSFDLSEKVEEKHENPVIKRKDRAFEDAKGLKND